jgi:hypothetical protein
MNRFLQALIALSGLTITGLLGWQSWQTQEKQAQQDLASLFMQQVSVAFSTCDELLFGLAMNNAQELSDRYGDDRYIEYAQAAAETNLASCKAKAVAIATPAPTPGDVATQPAPPVAGPPPSVVDSAPVQAQPPTPAQQKEIQLQKQIAVAPVRNLDLRLKERMQTRDAAVLAREEWFAVLASYKVGAEEKVLVDHFAKLQKETGDYTKAELRVYRTQSDLYTIVLAPNPPTQAAAKDLSALARKAGWARDSFWQPDKDWARCPDVNSAESVARCG